jgi:hypothetical protein
MSRELEFQLIEISHRLEQAEAKISLLQNPPDKLWMSPQEVDSYTQGKYIPCCSNNSPAQTDDRISWRFAI